jgi:hypothetical protein
MKQAWFSEEQIIAVPKEAEAGVKVSRTCVASRVSATRPLYKLAQPLWRAGGLGAAPTAPARRTESAAERIVADETLNIRVFKDVLTKTATAHGEAADGGGHDSSTLPIAASRLRTDRLSHDAGLGMHRQWIAPRTAAAASRAGQFTRVLDQLVRNARSGGGDSVG